MSVTEPQPAVPKPNRRWYRLTPDRVVIALLVVECLLWLSERFGWLAWHKGYAALSAVALVTMALVGMVIWFVVALIFRLRFQFSIRSLLVVTVAVAVPCTWLAVELKATREETTTIQKLGGSFAYDYQVDASGSSLPNSQPPGPVWLRRLLGDGFFEHIVRANLDNSNVTDAGLKELRGLRHLQYLRLWGDDITDAGLENFKGLTQLKVLLLSRTKVTDAGLEYFKSLRQLQSLILDDTRVTDAGLEHLEGLTQVQVLSLDGTQVTDDGLDHLKALNQLTHLYLMGTKVTATGVAKLQQALPNCKITR